MSLLKQAREGVSLDLFGSVVVWKYLVTVLNSPTWCDRNCGDFADMSFQNLL